MSAQFDPLASTYSDTLNASLRLSGETHRDFARLKVDRLYDAMRRLLGPPSALACLDVGCGTGVVEAILAPCVGRVVGCDPSEKMLEQARACCPEAAFVRLSEATLPFDDAQFDVVFTLVTYQYVPRHLRAAFAAELARVVRPGGLVFVFEHNPFNPLTHLVVRTCPDDWNMHMMAASETRRLLRGAGLYIEEQRYYYFFPRAMQCLRPLERVLGWLPLGGQYYVAARRGGP